MTQTLSPLDSLQLNIFGGDENKRRSGIWDHSGLFWCELPLSRDAGRAEREQQVGIVNSRMLSLFPRRPRVCLPLLVTLTLEDVMKHV